MLGTLLLGTEFFYDVNFIFTVLPISASGFSREQKSGDNLIHLF